MKKFLFLLLIFVVSIVSCEGNKTKADAFKESVSKFKDSLGTLEITAFIPEQYAEVKTDSIFSNGFSVSIKTYTNMKRFVTYKYQVDNTLTHIDNFRDWVSEVEIKKNNKVIFNRILDANFFLEKDKTIKDSLHKAINNKVWINEEFPLDNNYINLIGGLIYPDSKRVLYYDIKIDTQGKYTIKKIEDL